MTFEEYLKDLGRFSLGKRNTSSELGQDSGSKGLNEVH